MLIVIVASTLVWVVFTPDRLTPIVRDQAKNFITCNTQIDVVELTFFSTFPEFGLKLNGFTLINPTTGAPSDTLLAAKSAIATIDINAYLDSNQIIIKHILLADTKASVYSDANGHTNYDVFVTDTTTKDTAAFVNPFNLIALNKVSVKNANVSYRDDKSKLSSAIKALNADFIFELKKDLITATLDAQTPELSFTMDTIAFANKLNVVLNVPLTYDMKSQLLTLKSTKASVNKLPINLQGTVQTFAANSDVAMNLLFDTKSYTIKQLFSLVPASYLTSLKDITMDGNIATKGTVKGVFNEKSMPVIDLNVDLAEGNLAYKGFPYKLSDLTANLDVWLNMNKANDSKVTINSFSARTGKSKMEGKGFVDYIMMDDMLFDLDLKMRLNLPELKPMIPANLKLTMAGMVDGTATTRFMLSDAMNANLEKIQFSGKWNASNLDVKYDTISVFSDKAMVDIHLKKKNAAFLNASVWSNKLKVLQGKNTEMSLSNFKMQAETSNLTQTTQMQNMQLGFNFDQLAGTMDKMAVQLDKSVAQAGVKINFSDTVNMPQVNCNFDVSALNYTADSMQASVAYPKGSFTMRSDVQDPSKIIFDVNYRSTSTRANSGGNGFDARVMDVLANILYDKKASSTMLQWQPKGHIVMNDAHARLQNTDANISIPAVEFDFTPNEYNIKKAKMTVDNSDFELKGKLWNVTDYLNDKGLLMGDFTFNSQTIDLNRLMALTSGLGEKENKEPTEEKTVAATTPTDSAALAYMVPKGIDITLNADVKKALFSTDSAENVIGKLFVKDGLLVLQDMRFTTSAAKMQLTAMYKTPRKNHLYVGLDYHMLDVEISSLLKMIPDIDSIMPMLRSFAGKGEFHLAVETYMDSMYNLKKSTLRGVSSIKGQDLVLMDGQTFSEIAKKLLFSRKTTNKIDSVSAEVTIFKNEVDIYPFQIVMDKYKAVIAGKHNLDMTFDYHISLTDSPLPIKLGVNVTGDLDDMKIRLAKCKYAKLYRPAQRKEVDKQQLKIRDMIRKALTSRVVEE